MPNLRAMRLAGLFLCTCLSLFAANSYSQTQTLKYTYDELGRLTLVEDNKNGNRDYDYDAVGNRTLVTVVPVATPIISPNGGTYTSAQTVSISVSPSDATIRYTTNGSDVTASSTVYTGQFTVSSSATVKAKGFKSGMLESAQASTSLTINVSQLLAPTGLSSLPKSITGTSGMYESKWNPVAGATHYILKNINNSEVNTSSSTTVIQSSKGLWVKACNAAGCGPTANF